MTTAILFLGQIYWLIISSIPSSLVLLLFILSRKNRLTDREKAKSKKTIKKVIHGFNNLGERVDELNVKDFYKEVYHLWNTYLIHKFSINLSDLSRNKIKQILTDAKITSEDVILMDKILNNCEMSQYSPLTSNVAKETLNDSQILIKNLEKNVT